MCSNVVRDVLGDSRLGKRNREILEEFDRRYDELVASSVGLGTKEESFLILRELALQIGKSYEEMTDKDLQQYFSLLPQERIARNTTVLWSFYRGLYHSYTDKLPPVPVEDTFGWLSTINRDELRKLHV